MAFESPARKVHVRQHPADPRAMLRRRLGNLFALEASDDRRRLAVELTQQFVLQVGDRLGAGQAVAGKMRHQVEVERQFLAGELLEQGQHELAVRGGDEIIGVLDPRQNAVQIGEHADRVIAEPGRELFRRNGGEDGHERATDSVALRARRRTVRSRASRNG